MFRDRVKRPCSWRWGCMFLSVFLLVSLFCHLSGEVRAEGAQDTGAAKAALSKELEASRNFQEKTLQMLSNKEQKTLREGEPVAILEDIPGSPVKIGKGIGIIPYPTTVVIQVITDLENYKTFMPFTKESQVDLERSGGDVIYFSSRLDVPFIDDRYYTLKMTNEENLGGQRGTFFFSWSLDPEKKTNLYLNSGSWKLVPYGPSYGETLAFYTVITDPGGSIPNFIKNKSTKIGIPSVYEAITKRAKEGLKAGIYKLPLPEDELDRLLRKKVDASRDLDASYLEQLSQEDRQEVLDGDFLISMKDVEGTWVKMAQTVALFDAPSSRVWQVITAFDEYKDYIPYVAESRTDPERSRGNVTYSYSRLHFLIFPLIKDRYYTLKLISEKDVGGEKGVYFLRWQLDPTKESNVNENCGSWKLVPYGEKGEKTLVFYTILADPGGLSPWFWKNLSAKSAVKKVLKAIETRAEEKKGSP